jgi:hypothetical protein
LRKVDIGAGQRANPSSHLEDGFWLGFWSRANSKINEFLENEKAGVCSSKSLYLKNGCFSDSRVNLALLNLSNKCRNNREGCLPPLTHGS